MNLVLYSISNKGIVSTSVVVPLALYLLNECTTAVLHLPEQAYIKYTDKTI